MEKYLKKTIYDKILEVAAIAALLWMFYPLLFYSNIDSNALIPIHYNFFGEVDGWGGRPTLWITPLIGLALYIGLSIFQIGLSILQKHLQKCHDPGKTTAKKANYLRMGMRLGRMGWQFVSQEKLLSILLFAYVSNNIYSVAIGTTTELNIFILYILIAGMFVVDIIYTIKFLLEIIRTVKMKTVILFLAIFISGTFLHAQDVTGQWNGVLSVQGMNLRLVFNISQTADGYKSTMDSPDQGATGIPVAATTFDGTNLSLTVPNIGMSYEGAFKTDSIVGTFKQGAFSVPMTLKRTPVEVKPLIRPQEPKPPYPYRSEEITFENKTAVGVTLAGTLTMPETGSNFTAVILITGSGAQDRNQEIMGHKPFLVIADYLTRNGIAVLCYDDRGFAQSTGDIRTATTADFATDVESAIAYLKTRNEINPQKIGLMGHSEGGVIAPMVAARSEDVAFIIMLAGTGMRGDAVLLQQCELINRASGMSEEMIAATCGINAKIINRIINAKGDVSQEEITGLLTELKSDIEAITPEGVTTDDFIKLATEQASSPWVQYFMRYDPVPALEKVKCPVLALNGSKDLQVPAKENLEAISAALKKGGNKNITTKEYRGLNHLFQECTTGSPDEYATIEQTFSPEVLKDLGDWMLTR